MFVQTAARCKLFLALKLSVRPAQWFEFDMPALGPLYGPQLRTYVLNWV